MPTREDKEERDRVRAEIREKGYESRPTSRTQREEAERLNRGFAILEAEDAGEEIDSDDDE